MPDQRIARQTGHRRDPRRGRELLRRIPDDVVSTERLVQPAEAPQGDLPEAVTTERVREEWRARIAAEYTSAAITQQLVLWLIQAGAPPDLIDAGLAIVADELVHSRMSAEVYAAAGGSEPPAIDRVALALPSTGALDRDILRTAVRVFCLGET